MQCIKYAVNMKQNHSTHMWVHNAIYMQRVCSTHAACRCFGGELVSEYELTSATGNTIGLRSLAKIGKTPVTGPMFPALRRKLKNCCALKTKAYVRYAQEECGSKLLTNLCAAPNGYEPRFGHEGLGADKHFPKSPCIAQAWTKFELLTVAEKNKKAQELSLKFLESSSGTLLAPLAGLTLPE